jgi:hypothetical protein
LSRIELDRLSPEQQARLPLYRARWERVRLSTAPADRAAAEVATGEAYRAAGLAPPDRIIWCGGPVDVARSCADTGLSAAGDNVKSQLVDAVVRQAAYAVDGSVSGQVRTRIAATFRPQPVNPVSVAVTTAVTLSDPLGPGSRFAAVRSVVRRLRGRMLPRWMEASFRDSSFSQHDAASLGIFEYLHEACALQRQTERVMALCRMAANIGWVIPHRRVCWLVERHNVLETDDRGRLHSAKGPAIAFADGWSVYAWKGVLLPSWMIERPHEITASRIDRERDAIVRRCMIDIMTPERFIREGDAYCVSEDETGMLWTKNWTAWDAWAAVQVQNGTPEPDGTYRQYFLQVPPTVRSARQAVAWTYGLTEHEYTALRHRT